MATHTSDDARHPARVASIGFADRLREARKAAGYTQKQVAAQMGLSGQTIQNWEAERTCPRREMVEQIADIYGVDPQHLIGLEPEADDPSEVGFRVTVDTRRMKLGRMLAGLTQDEASSAVGVSGSTLGRYENGAAEPPARILRKLAALYQRPVQWFLPRKPLPQIDAQPDNVRRELGENDLYEDEVMQAYRLAQRDLPTAAVTSIADYIRFMHARELSPPSETP